MSSITSRIRRSTMMVAVGAAAAYFLDPVNGEARRREVSSRAQHLLDRALPSPSDGPDRITDPVDPAQAVRDAAQHADPTGGATPLGPEEMPLGPEGVVPTGAPTPVVLP